MKMFFSGGGSPWLPEMQLTKPDVMLSFFMVACAPHLKKGQKEIKKYDPDTRVKRLVKSRKKAKRQKSLKDAK